MLLLLLLNGHSILTEGGSVTWKKDVEAWLEPTVEDT